VEPETESASAVGFDIVVVAQGTGRDLHPGRHIRTEFVQELHNDDADFRGTEGCAVEDLNFCLKVLRFVERDRTPDRRLTEDQGPLRVLVG
jgi:hypothetical protein